MTRSIALLLMLSATVPAFSQKDNQTVSSKIEKVTVFIQGAQVERSAQQILKPGKYNIVFDGISPKIDKQSIQLKADGKLTVLSVTQQVNFLKEQQVQEEIKQLETQKEQWQDKIALEKNMRNVYSQEERMILANQSIKGDATLKAAELKEAADFQRQRLTEIYMKLQDNDHNLKKMDGELQKINKQLSELNEKKELSTSEVIVALDVKENTTANFRLTYLVHESSWFPTYDIRVKDISQPISMQMKANINQASGEDWKDVKLFLSTGDPNENGTKPTLSPWYLHYYSPTAYNRRQIRDDNSLAGKTLDEVVVTGYGTSKRTDASEDSDDYKSVKERREKTAINTTTTYQATTTIFEIENPYSVPTDGKTYTVDINSFELNALYEYYAVPKIDASAFLTAKITDWQDLNLLPGEANLFFEGTFLGNSLLDVMNAGDTLSLSLGKDKGVVVKRTLMKEYSSKKFLGSNKTDSRQYEIMVRNNKPQPIKIIVEDQFPVSTSKEIEVDKLSYDNGKLDDDTKKVTWSISVDGKKENKLQLGYAVKYPKEKTLVLE